MLVPGFALIAGTFWFTQQYVPEQKKLPDNLNRTMHYEGNVTLYVDPATNQPLAQPKVVPLTVDRNVASVKALTNSNDVVMHETLHLVSPGLFDTTQQNQYVMDRVTAENVKDQNAWAYTPTNVVDRSHTFYLAFGLNMDKTTDQTTYKNEVAASYVASPSGQSKIDGLPTTLLSAQRAWTPVSAAYLAELNQSVPLPAQLTFDQMKPLLTAQGLNVDALLSAMVPKIAAQSQADLQALLKISQQPIPLAYVTKWGGSTAIDPVTGAPVDVQQANDTIGATPTAAWTSSLTSILDKYPQVPEAVTMSTAVKATAANPIPVFATSYHQTPASVSYDVAKAKDDGAALRQATILSSAGWIAAGLLILAGLVLIVLPKRGEGGSEPAVELTPPQPAESLDDDHFHMV
jgi:hypothetical protein